MKNVQIKDAVLFVTGSNRGIGKAIVEEAIKGGARKVYAGARNVDTLKDLVASSNGKVVAVSLDVTNEDQIRAAAAAAEDTQILINNAGVANYTAIVAADNIQSARQEMEVNYFGLMNMTRAFAPILKKNNGGVLVNISSVAGLTGIPLFGTYAASKAAVHSLTQSVRGELKAQGTYVVTVYPGPIDTDMAAGVEMEKESPQHAAQQIFRGLASGAEEIFPDKGSKDFAVKFKADPKAVENEWATILPQAVEQKK